MIIEIRLQNTLWQTRTLPSPGYSVTQILNSIESDRAAGELAWVLWDQPLRLDIQVVE